MICDSHVHLGSFENDFLFDSKMILCTCSSSSAEFLRQEKACVRLENAESTAVRAFGLHPLYLKNAEIHFLEQLLEEKKIGAIGEIGLDFFTKEGKQTAENQEKIFSVQLRLSARFGLPVVVHCRKALSRIFTFAPLLKKCPSVVFHGFEGRAADATAILKRGINAYFGIGKNLLRGDKSAADCAKNLEKTRIMFETDSPFQALYGEKLSKPADVLAVCKKASELRGEELSEIARENFFRAFSLS